jgi:4,5-dihydroxyphthalate decarboxylase
VRGILGADPWPYGVEPNRVALEALLRYSREQGLLAGAVDVDDLFLKVETFVDGTA